MSTSKYGVYEDNKWKRLQISEEGTDRQQKQIKETVGNQGWLTMNKIINDDKPINDDEFSHG